MPIWPTTLPAPALNSFTETPPANTIRSTTDKGPAKVRRRTTANVRQIGFNLNLTPAQVNMLDEFYTETTYGGALTFDYIHPRTDQPVTARFIQPPQYSEREGMLYNVPITLEILP